MKRAVSAKAVSGPKTWCGRTTYAQTLLGPRMRLVKLKASTFLAILEIFAQACACVIAND